MIYDFVFVVLVYRNTSDLREFFGSGRLPNSKVIVVNSYYDDSSKREFEDIAKANGADFLNVPNKGYGAGNNSGCDYALKNYSFKYLIISNADIIIKCLDVSQLSSEHITAPSITTLKGKRQNPHIPYGWNWMIRMKYNLLVKRSRKRFMLLMMLSRIVRELFLLTHKSGNVFSAHGAFVIIPHDILERMHPIYNERQFLFCEEDHLAMKSKSLGISTFYDSSIRILHKEDGSVSLIKSVNEITRKSYIEFYNTWFRTTNN